MMDPREVGELSAGHEPLPKFRVQGFEGLQNFGGRLLRGFLKW